MENGIPKHLKPYVAVTRKPSTLNDAFEVVGNVRCKCGGKDFVIIREKKEQTQESKAAEKQIEKLFTKYKNKCAEKNDLCITSRNGRDYIACVNFDTDRERLLEDITELQKLAYGGLITPIYFMAICSQCGQEILIFDSRKHGYNSLTALDQKNYSEDFRTEKRGKCSKCGYESTEISLAISSTGKSDLLNENAEVINNNNWENAFDWFTVSVKCSGCGKETKKYLDVETM